MPLVRRLLWSITALLPRKVIRGPDGAVILERYHLWGRLERGGLAIHRFVRSDPGRGGHDHPWGWAASLILSGGYAEWLLPTNPADPIVVRHLTPGCLNLLPGERFHRVMLAPGAEAWTLFWHGPRQKRWGFRSEDARVYTPYSAQVADRDGAWWRGAARRGDAA